MDLEISPQFSKNIQIPHFLKIRLVEAELFHARGQTDMTKLTVALRNFANALNNSATDKLSTAIVTPHLQSHSCTEQRRISTSNTTQNKHSVLFTVLIRFQSDLEECKRQGRKN
jgi:hypothetical protein